MRATLTRLNVADLASVTDQLTFLRDLAGIQQIVEYDTRRKATLINASGVHLLSGHVGKGQQFDWVFIVGAEDDNMPVFRAHEQCR